jgi:hypothetical protein
MASKCDILRKMKEAKIRENYFMCPAIFISKVQFSTPEESPVDESIIFINTCRLF